MKRRTVGVEGTDGQRIEIPLDWMLERVAANCRAGNTARGAWLEAIEQWEERENDRAETESAP